METITLVALSLLPALVIAAALSDLTSMTIPNWISAALIVLFFPAAYLVGLPAAAVAVHVGVALLALVLGAGMFALRWIGGGDAKLIAAAGLWLGLQGGIQFVVWTAIAGGGFCLVLLLARKGLGSLAGAGPGWVGRLLEPKGDIPYGVAICAGALMAFPASPLVTAFAAG